MGKRKGNKKPSGLSKNLPIEKVADQKSIEVKAAQNKTFFTKKNTFFLILFFVLSIALLVLTIKFILNIDFVALIDSITHGFSEQFGPLWFTLLLIYFIWIPFSIYAGVWPRLKKLGYHIPQWEYWLFGFTIAFLRATTPPMFSDPYFIFWLKTKGVPTSRATSVLFSNTLLWQIVQFTVTLPSFIVILVFRENLLNNPEGLSSFIFLCAGMTIDAFSIAFMFLMNMSKNVHYGLSSVFNWIKKKLHMKYHTKAEVKMKYKDKATLKSEFIEYMKDWKSTAIILGILIFSELILYFAVNWSLYFVKNYVQDGIIYNTSFSFWMTFNCANVTFTANRLNFIAPNGEGSLQFFLSTFLTRVGGFTIDQPIEDPKPIVKAVVDNAILVWRIFGSYLPALFGLGTLIALSTIQAKRYKHNKITWKKQ